MVEISTSILSINKDDIITKIYDLETAKTDFFHIDVMDGLFVNNNTNELMNNYCEHIKQISNIPLDIHLMVSDVKTYIKNYLVYEPSIITFHLEACKNRDEIFDLINFIKQNNCKVGISIKPDTKTDEIKNFLPYISMCLIMTVEPGEGGQKLLTYTIDKIKDLKKYMEENNLETFIEVDGGINLENIKTIKDAGADIIVSGSCIINSKDIKDTISKMKS